MIAAGCARRGCISPAPELDTSRFELATEIFYKEYRLYVATWASQVKPDFQYIVNPSGTLRDADRGERAGGNCILINARIWRRCSA